MSMIMDKRKKLIEDNDIIDLEKLIENMENKKENEILKNKRPSTATSVPKKKFHKKTG